MANSELYAISFNQKRLRVGVVSKPLSFLCPLIDTKTGREYLFTSDIF